MRVNLASLIEDGVTRLTPQSYHFGFGYNSVKYSCIAILYAFSQRFRTTFTEDAVFEKALNKFYQELGYPFENGEPELFTSLVSYDEAQEARLTWMLVMLGFAKSVNAVYDSDMEEILW